MGTFIFSLDCEGKWGVADHLSRKHMELFTDAKLLKTYRAICESLVRHQVPSTFAFTGGFSLSKEQWFVMEEDVQRISRLLPQWMSCVRHDMALNGFQGWFGSGCLELVREAGIHEVAAHGFTHVPWGSSEMSVEAARYEISLCRKVFGPSLKTFIYPRNSVAFEECLLGEGIAGYRLARAGSSRFNRLAAEFNIYECSDSHPDSESLVKIPAGFFMNWRSGLRRVVPMSVTLMRWQRIIDHAIETNGVAHMWTHPENFLDGHGMHELLDGILRYVNQRVRDGDLRILTQDAYCAQFQKLRV